MSILKNNFVTETEQLKKEMAELWGFADFGKITKTHVIKNGLLKCASGYSQGHTSETILKELKMINNKYKLTKKGQFWLWKLCHDTDFK